MQDTSVNQVIVIVRSSMYMSLLTSKIHAKVKLFLRSIILQLLLCGLNDFMEHLLYEDQ